MTVQQFNEGMKTVTPLVIGIALVYIAFRQWVTNRHKLKLDLFDRRFKIYQAARTLLSHVVSSLSPEVEEIRAFHRQTQEAEFLLSPGLAQFLSDLAKNALNLRVVSKRMNQMGPIDDPKLIESLSEQDKKLVEWMIDADKHLVDKFRGDLSLRDVK